MANRIVQAVYDLKDQVTAKLKNIGAALRGNRLDADKTADGVERSNRRISASYAAVSAAVKKFGGVLIAAAVVKSLDLLKDGIAAVLQTGEKFDDLGKKFATAFGGLEQGAVAMDQVRKFAEGVPQSFEDVSDAAIQLKRLGFDPLDGSLQALVDNNNAVDGSQQDLIATIDALGKANLRGSINTRALVALQQQGIPVTKLLGEAYGKSADEIRRMAAGGQLGADAIKTLVSELGELRKGASAGEVGDLDAQLQKLRDTLQGIQNDLAQGGPLELARKQLVDLNAEVKRLAATPEFAKLKEELTGAFEAGVEASREFLDNFDFTRVIGQISVLTSALKNTFRILESSDKLIEPLFDALSYLTLPFDKLKEAAAQGLGYVADGLDAVTGKAKDAKEAIEGTLSPLALVRDEVALAEMAIAGFRKAVATSKASENGLSLEAQEIVDSLADVVEQEGSARAAIKGLFASINEQSETKLGDVALAMAKIGNDSGIAGENVRTGLREQLAKLSGEDLLKFQTAAQKAFTAYNTSAVESAGVLGATLQRALEKVGVTGDSLGVAFTESGKDIIATFQAIAESAVASSAQIEAGFKAALAKVSTSAEAQALGDALEAAAKRGAVGIDAAARATAALTAKVRELQEAANPLADAFERLGITSQKELRNAAATAGEAFDQIVSGAQRGSAATEDVRNAFVAYAKAQLDAVRNASAWERQQVESTLRVRAASLGVTEALTEVGLAGAEAGAQVTAGAQRAETALRGAEAAATDLASSNINVSNTFVQVGNEANITSGAIEGVSEKFKQLISDQRLYEGGGVGLFTELNEQTRALEMQLQLLRDQNAEYDETDRRVRDLRGQYNFLSDDRLRQLAQEQLRLEENRRKAADDAAARKQALVDEQQQRQKIRDGDNSSSAGGGGASGARTEPARFELVIRNEQRAGSILSELTDRDINELGQRLAAEWNFARASSS